MNDSIKQNILFISLLLIFMVGWINNKPTEIEEPIVEELVYIPKVELTEINETVETVPEVEVKEPEPIINLESLGEFTLTAYCPCRSCSGKWGRKTSTGVVATANRTIAVDPKIIPYGSEIVINDQHYIAEDCGGAIKKNKIDIFFDTHHETVQFGKQKAEVFIVR